MLILARLQDLSRGGGAKFLGLSTFCKQTSKNGTKDSSSVSDPDPPHLAGSGSTSIPAPDPDSDPDPRST